MKVAVRILLPVLVLAVGIVAMKKLIATKPEIPRRPAQAQRTPVETQPLALVDEVVRVQAYGRIIPAKQIVVSAEIGGRLEWLPDNFVPGTPIRKGQQLARIDARDLSLAVQQQLAQVERARTELEVERSRKQIAESEWKLVGPPGATSDRSPLALREPQYKTAEVAVRSAQSSLERARLAKTKSTLRAPWNGILQKKHVDVGQLVGPTTAIATLVGTDSYWVEVSVPVAHLEHIEIPGIASATEGSVAVVRARFGSRTLEHAGKVIRLLGDLQNDGRMARLLVEIVDPRNAHSGARSKELPLLLGAFVEVEIEGRTLEQVVKIPRAAIRDGQSVLVYSEGDLLAIRHFEPVWSAREFVLITPRPGQLEAGVEVIISPIARPIAGMALSRNARPPTAKTTTPLPAAASGTAP